MKIYIIISRTEKKRTWCRDEICLLNDALALDVVTVC